MIRLLAFFALVFPFAVSSQVSTTVPKETVEGYTGMIWKTNGGYCTTQANISGEYLDSEDAASQYLSYRGWISFEPIADLCNGHGAYKFYTGDNALGNPVYMSLSVALTGSAQVPSCPESHPVDNGDGTCSLAPPEEIEDCPIGTMASIGGVLGDGSAPECVPFQCEVGGQNVSIPSQFFDVDFGGASFSYCDGSCAFSVQSGSGGQVNAWGTGMACGNGTPDYVYAVPSFDDASCTSGDGWVDCSDNPQKVDEDNPQNPEVPTTPDDLGAPLEETPDPVEEPLPDCTAETALSGSCFVNSMDAVQGNIVNGITAEQSQQTDRIVTALAGLGTKLVESESDAADKITKAIKEGERASALPFLRESFRPVAQDDLNGLTVSEIATATGEDLTGIDFDNLIPKTTKALGWNPTEYQFGVGGGLCPEPTSLVIGGQTISIDWTMFCDMAVIINAFLIAAAYFIGGQIIMRAM